MQNRFKTCQRYLVVQSNWQCEVELDKEASQLDDDQQSLEAATRAVEVFEGNRSEPKLTMFPDCAQQKPTLGTLMLVCRSDDDSGRLALIYTHVCLANIGLHEKAAKMRAELDAHMRSVNN